MSSYLADVLSYHDATVAWVCSHEYVRVSRGVDRSIAEMRNSLGSFVARCRNAEANGYTSGSASHSFPSPPDPTDASEALVSFLSSLHPQRSRATPSLPDADRVLLTSNFRPLSDVLPYTDPDFYACRSSRTSSSASSSSMGSSTAYSDPPRASRKGKERALPAHTRSPSPGASGWSTEAEADFSHCLPPTLHLSASPETADNQDIPSTRKRSHPELEGLPSPPKKRRVSLEVHGVYGGLPDSDAAKAVAERVRPYIGRTVPLVEDLSPFHLPSPCSPPSPEPSESIHASSNLPPSPFPASVESTPSPELSSTFDISVLHEEEESCFASESIASSSFEEDVETTSDSSSYVTAWDVAPADGLGDHPVITGTQVNARAARTPEAPERTRTASRKRRCFAGLLQTMRHIFARR
ncbi:hypothetical protein C8T65DRAFT_639451 [Cerioporus squamosus]|nr:hypothetical protein C8T65DRAFT_639451 [Cerioporus squamosus]